MGTAINKTERKTTVVKTTRVASLSGRAYSEFPAYRIITMIVFQKI